MVNNPEQEANIPEEEVVGQAQEVLAEEEPNTATPENESDNMAAELASLKDKYLRLFAEFDTFRRRTAQERIQMEQTASRKVLNALIPVLDDFDRAAKYSEAGLPEGIVLVHQKFLSVLSAQGLKAMESTGELFNADFHEAVTEFPAPTEDLKGKVIDTTEKGYFLGDTILRHAKVIVGK